MQPRGFNSNWHVITTSLKKALVKLLVSSYSQNQPKKGFLKTSRTHLADEWEEVPCTKGPELESRNRQYKVRLLWSVGAHMEEPVFWHTWLVA